MLLAAVLARVAIVLAATPVVSVDVPLLATLRASAMPELADLELTNTGSKTAVAWSLSFVTENGEGGRTTQDVYQQLLDPDRPGSKLLLPGVPTVVSARGIRELDATITPLAVVYADRTAIGDPERIDDIFARRRTEAKAWADVIPKLEALAAAGVDAKSLAAAASAYADPALEKRGSFVYGGLARNLALLAKADDPARSFQSALQGMRRQADLAREHAVRRP